MAEPQEASTSILDFGAIPAQDFQRRDVEVATNYIFGTPVTRENFTAVIINSFRVSVGYPAVQQAYLEWLNIHRGFNYVTSIRNLFKGGGIPKALTEAEQAMFLDAYMGINQHREKPVELPVDDEKKVEVFNSIHNELNKQTKNGYNGRTFSNKPEDQIYRQSLISMEQDDVLPFLHDYTKRRMDRDKVRSSV